MYPKLLESLSYISWNEALEAINTVLDAISEGFNYDQIPLFVFQRVDNSLSQSTPLHHSDTIESVKTIYELTLKALKDHGHQV